MTMAQSLPIDFEDVADDAFVGDGGSVYSLAVSPTDATDNVGKIVGGTDQWNSRIDIDLDTYIDMTTANKTFTFEIYTSEAVVMKGLFQISKDKNGGYPIEMEFTTDGAIGWQTITLDFTGAANGWPNADKPVVYGHYEGLSIFTNFGDDGTSIYYVDDIAGAANGSAVLPDPVPVNMLNDFDGTSVCTVVETMGDPAPVFNIIDNPAGGTNQVFEFVKPTASGWGNWDRIHFELSESIEIIDGKAAFSIKAYSPATKGFLLKIADDRDSDNAPNKAEIWQDVTEVDTWQTLTYVFTGLKDAEYKHVFIYPAGGDGDLNSYYIDDVMGPNLKSATAITEAKAERLSVYPNPVTDILNISNMESGTSVSIYNTAGSLLKKVVASNGTINVSELPKGIYFVSVNGATTKIIKK